MIKLVYRNEETGRELLHQFFKDEKQADRVMIARNRAEILNRSNMRWGVETVSSELDKSFFLEEKA